MERTIEHKHSMASWKGSGWSLYRRLKLDCLKGKGGSLGPRAEALLPHLL
jgi:hypothetical protein